jgi:hypothetical protein
MGYNAKKENFLANLKVGWGKSDEGGGGGSAVSEVSVGQKQSGHRGY